MRASKQGSTYNVSIILLAGILKEINLEGNPLNNYISVKQDLFFDGKIPYIKVNKVRGHLLSQYTMLEIGLLIVREIFTMFRRIFK